MAVFLCLWFQISFEIIKKQRDANSAMHNIVTMPCVISNFNINEESVCAGGISPKGVQVLPSTPPGMCRSWMKREIFRVLPKCTWSIAALVKAGWLSGLTYSSSRVVSSNIVRSTVEACIFIFDSSWSLNRDNPRSLIRWLINQPPNLAEMPQLRWSFPTLPIRVKSIGRKSAQNPLLLSKDTLNWMVEHYPFHGPFIFEIY